MDTIKTFELFECQQVLLQIDGLLTYDGDIVHQKNYETGRTETSSIIRNSPHQYLDIESHADNIGASDPQINCPVHTFRIRQLR